MLTKLLQYYFEIHQWQKMPIEKVKILQLMRFIKLFEYAKVHSKFYNKLYKDAGVFDLKIKSFEDIEKLPIIDKNLLRKYSYDDILTEPITGKLNEHSTSGSSGEPVKLYFNRYVDYTSHVRVFYALRKAAGYTPFKKITMITRYEENEHFQIENDLSVLNKIQKVFGFFQRDIISIYTDPDIIIEKIIQSDPYVLWSTPSVLEMVVNRMLAKGISLRIPFIFFTSENLSPLQYNKFTKTLSQNIVDIYGSMESPCLGYEINKSGFRHVYPNSNLFELVNHRMSEIGKLGDVLITNLLNFSMPIIRYDLRDMCKVLDDDRFPNQVIGEVIGRIDDILDFPDGNKFVHHHAHEMFMDFEECDQFKFVQDKYGQIRLQLKANYKYSKMDIKTKAMQKWNKRFSRYPLQIDFVDAFEIDPKSGKFKNIEKLNS
jgi:phenylacetate-coenzyme A ligase PaaK-like adenylate-forming protein